jgi:hypothetical protein
MLRPLLVMVCLLCCPSAISADDGDFKARGDAWSKWLLGHGFHFGREMANRGYSISTLRELKSPNELHFALKPDPDGHGTPDQFLLIIRDGKTVAEIKTHWGCTFEVFEDVLYFVQNHDDDAGCTIVAYSMLDGSVAWTNDKLGMHPAGHSGYGNLTYIGISNGHEVPGEQDGDSIILRGRESYGDYMTVLDRQTGQVVANHVFREGFGTKSKTE